MLEDKKWVRENNVSRAEGTRIGVQSANKNTRVKGKERRKN